VRPPPLSVAGLFRVQNYRRRTSARRFAFERNDKALADAEVLDGTLMLLTSIDAAAMSAAGIVERYKALADIERGFRVLKSDIDIAPVHHRLPERIRAHALICFLALLLHRLLRLRLKATSSAFSPQRALATLRQIQRHRIHIGETEHSGIIRPTEEQLQLFEELKLPALR
jgi:transposase